MTGYLWISLTFGWLQMQPTVSVGPLLWFEHTPQEGHTTLEPCTVTTDFKELEIESRIESYVGIPKRTDQ